MKPVEMKIERRDILLIALCAVGGFILVTVAIGGRNLAGSIFVGLVAGAPSGAAGGVLACLIRRFLQRK